MSVSKWAYTPEMCDGDICVGDCDLCDKPKVAQIHNTATTQVQTDHIKREHAIAEACKGCNEEFSDEPCEPSDCCIMQRLADIPSADVRENVKGHWIRFKNIAECSNCKAVWYDNLDLITKSWSFCPNCGADMRGEA